MSFAGNVSQSEQEETGAVPRHAAVLPDPCFSTDNPVCSYQSDGEVKKEKSF